MEYGAVLLVRFQDPAVVIQAMNMRASSMGEEALTILFIGSVRDHESLHLTVLRSLLLNNGLRVQVEAHQTLQARLSILDAGGGSHQRLHGRFSHARSLK